jgi:hypothetical protein
MISERGYSVLSATSKSRSGHSIILESRALFVTLTCAMMNLRPRR